MKTKKIIKIVSIMLIAILMLTACMPGKVENESKGETSDLKLEISKVLAKPNDVKSVKNDTSEDIKNILNTFSSKTSSIVLKSDNKNMVYSPISVYYATAMLREMADGETLTKLSQYMGAENIELAAELQKIMENEKALNGLQINNSYWVSLNHADNTSPNFLNVLKEHFYAYAFATDFTNEGAYNDIDNWAKIATNDMIDYNSKDLFQSPNIVSVLLNAVFFQSNWENQFNKDNNYKDKFYGIDGQVSEIEYMFQMIEKGEFTVGEDYDAATLSMKNGSMHFILPKNDKTVDQLLENENFFNEYMSAERTNGVLNISIPKYEVESELKNLLDLLGLSDIVGEAAAPNLSRAFKTGGEGFAVSGIIQVAKVEVYEEGAKAAAVTAEVVEESMPIGDELEIKFDKPFIFLITLNGGEIIFTGKVVKF
ncbi:serpin family protein [Microaceticoccus formicicus]|uniref:serpin family protein n=1 Tax=Microaceticoccus formicicus TaxID=3118105 RepID=UPI003CD012A6|nr:serpin family protein [Peptoniphilaceae bacterium AMB_02]